ncbi:MAG: hypothetical protein HPY61_12835 [Methanotrichaceae archaeon]|nr:hypothetical protein [Methanotrichaceae archaeon]
MVGLSETEPPQISAEDRRMGDLKRNLALVEFNACFADEVQAVSGCTLGNNAQVYPDLGHLAVAFAICGKGIGVCIRVRPEFSSSVARAALEFYSGGRTACVLLARLRT